MSERTPAPEYDHLTDRQLLEIISDVMIGYDFIGDVLDLVTDQARVDFDNLYPAYVQLRCALTAAQYRIVQHASADDGGEA